jgi:hypothetical protein
MSSTPLDLLDKWKLNPIASLQERYKLSSKQSVYDIASEWIWTNKGNY